VGIDRTTLAPSKAEALPVSGAQACSNRAALTGILFVLKSGIRWSELPSEMGCGSGISCWRRLRDWQQAGVWDRLHEILLAKLRAADRIDFSRVVIDSTSVRAVGAGEKLDRTPPIVRDPVPNITSPPTPTARRSRSS
jgi:transposase